MQAQQFLLKHSKELSEKYSGRYLAIVGDDVVAVGKSILEVYRIAKDKFPDRKISLIYMPTEEETVTLLWNFHTSR
ncbi:MAG: DUF5678 domain-containing protein [Methanosarcinales archaeon]